MSDGKAIAEGLRITVSTERVKDSQTTNLAPDGSFEFSGLASGDYTLFASVRGYAPLSESGEIVKVDGDVSGYTMTLKPCNRAVY